MKAALQNLALVFVSSLIALAGIEAGLRVWGPDVLAMGNLYVFNQFDAVLGWANLPNSHGQFSRMEFSYPVDINTLGMRDREVADKREGEFRVAVLGDSFTWGVGAAYGERFTEVVERLDPRINALNFGVSGYSPIQYLLELDKVLALKPDHVIVVFCLGNDLTDNVRPDPYVRPKPYALLSADESRLEIKGYPLEDTKETGTRLIGAESPLRLVGFIEYQLDRLLRRRANADVIDWQWLYTPRESLAADQQQKVALVYKVNELLLGAIRQRIEAALGPDRFAVLLAPTKFEYGLDPGLPPHADYDAVAKAVLATLARLQIPAIDGRAAISAGDFWKVDGHWRPSGHEKIGKLLASFLDEAMAGQHPMTFP